MLRGLVSLERDKINLDFKNNEVDHDGVDSSGNMLITTDMNSICILNKL